MKIPAQIICFYNRSYRQLLKNQARNGNPYILEVTSFTERQNNEFALKNAK